MPTDDAARAFLGRPATAVEAEGVASLWESVRARWPNLALEGPEFFAAVGERTGHQLTAAAGLQLADLYLAMACLKGDRVALSHFDRELLPRVRPMLARLGDEDFRDEVLQRTREHLLIPEAGRPPRLTTYTGQGSLLNWVRSVLFRLALTMHRLARPAENAELLEVMPEPAWSAELQYIRLAHRDAFARAFSEALAEVDETERAVLRLNLVERLNIEKIGAIYGVHRATVARWVARGRTQLVAGVEARLRERLALSPEEYDAMLQSLQDNLGVSLGRLIDEGGSS